ncbi:MAG: TetR/AcrR family transcriptional regulator [Pseudomonadota bacterium]
MESKTVKTGLSRPLILQAAVRFVDREGLDALSMRKLGDDLGVEAMSLYRYVASKNDLLDGVHEVVLREMPAMTLGGRWREDLRTVARAFRFILLRHPRCLPLFSTRPVLTPGSLPFVEMLLALFREAGFAGAQALSALHLFHHLVVGHCALHADTQASLGQAAAMLEAAGEDFPHTTAALTLATPRSVDEEFEFGLAALLAGLDGTLSQGVADLLREIS